MQNGMQTYITVNEWGNVVAWLCYALASAFALTAAVSRKADTQRPFWKWATVGTLAVGLCAHVIAIGAITVGVGRAPWGSLYEWVSTVSAGIAAVALFWLLLKRWLYGIAGFVLMLSTALLLTSAFLYTPPVALQPALRSNWLTFHVFLAITGSVLLLSGGVISALYLIRLSWEGRHPEWSPTEETFWAPDDADAADAPVPPPPAVVVGPGAAALEAPRRGIIATLPPATRLDDLARKIFTLAFPIWTLAIFAGAVWGEQAWGRPWGWDPKETTSFIIWGLFAAYLHARATRGWKGRPAAILGVVGASFVLFNVFVVNLVISGLHSYAGV